MSDFYVSKYIDKSGIMIVGKYFDNEWLFIGVNVERLTVEVGDIDWLKWVLDQYYENKARVYGCGFKSNKAYRRDTINDVVGRLMELHPFLLDREVSTCSYDIIGESWDDLIYLTSIHYGQENKGKRIYISERSFDVYSSALDSTRVNSLMPRSIRVFRKEEEEQRSIEEMSLSGMAAQLNYEISNCSDGLRIKIEGCNVKYLCIPDGFNVVALRKCNIERLAVGRCAVEFGMTNCRVGILSFSNCERYIHFHGYNNHVEVLEVPTKVTKFRGVSSDGIRHIEGLDRLEYLNNVIMFKYVDDDVIDLRNIRYMQYIVLKSIACNSNIKKVKFSSKLKFIEIPDYETPLALADKSDVEIEYTGKRTDRAYKMLKLAMTGNDELVDAKLTVVEPTEDWSD